MINLEGTNQKKKEKKSAVKRGVWKGSNAEELSPVVGLSTNLKTL